MPHEIWAPRTHGNIWGRVRHEITAGFLQNLTQTYWLFVWSGLAWVVDRVEIRSKMTCETRVRGDGLPRPKLGRITHVAPVIGLDANSNVSCTCMAFGRGKIEPLGPNFGRLQVRTSPSIIGDPRYIPPKSLGSITTRISQPTFDDHRYRTTTSI